MKKGKKKHSNQLCLYRTARKVVAKGKIMKTFVLAFGIVQWLVPQANVSAFTLPSSSSALTRHKSGSSSITTFHDDKSSTALHGVRDLLGRFRRKREVEQVTMVQPGDVIPDVDVDLVLSAADAAAAGLEGQDIPAATIPAVSATTSALEYLQKFDKAIVVGMPGAFTPTCSQEHLPGFQRALPELVQLGVDKVAILTTNDKFVNEAWMEDRGIAVHDAFVPADEADGDDGSYETGRDMAFLCDGDGDLVKAMGMADDMGFGVGVRSKRFVLVTESGGKVVHCLTDEGMEDCSATSAASVLALLSIAWAMAGFPVADAAAGLLVAGCSS